MYLSRDHLVLICKVLQMVLKLQKKSLLSSKVIPEDRLLETDLMLSKINMFLKTEFKE